MLSGAVSAALIWLAAGFPEAAVPTTPEAAPPALENIYYVQVDGMT
jgi:hypothetical protein